MLQCQACKECFTTKGKLIRHEKTHKEKVDKPYSCIECQKSDITHIAANSCEQIHTALSKWCSMVVSAPRLYMYQRCKCTRVVSASWL